MLVNQMGVCLCACAGPLLTLILADREHLVLQTMPSQLLEQSRNILRSRFSSLISKRVYTLQFERSCDDSAEQVRELTLIGYRS